MVLKEKFTLERKCFTCPALGGVFLLKILLCEKAVLVSSAFRAASWQAPGASVVWKGGTGAQGCPCLSPALA